MNKKVILVSTSLALMSACWIKLGSSTLMIPLITSLEQVKELFPATPQELEYRAQQLMSKVKDQLNTLIAIPRKQRTYNNTLGALDQMTGAFESYASIIHALEMTSPDALMRESARSMLIALQAFAIEQFSTNKQLYKACKDYVEDNFLQEKSQLSPEKIFATHETMKAFIRAGLELPDEQLEHYKELQKELATLTMNYETNINNDNRTILVNHDGLKGLSEKFVASLSRDDKGNYILQADYPTRDQIMAYCEIEETRASFWNLFNNRAYPVNEPILQKVIALRDKSAQLLGYKNFADYDCDDTMAQSVKRIDNFLQDLIKRSQQKVDQEIAAFIKNLPQGITLKEGKIKPWDLEFIKNYYKNKFYGIDELKIAEYFPMESTIQGLLSIYEKFFDIIFKPIELEGLWHPEVKAIQVSDKQGTLIGYLLLDLHPRDFKYTHACQITLVPTVTQEKYYPGVALVLANFPKPTATEPSLLLHRDVITFFHEFGHALHALFGSTQTVGFSGTHVKMDFVEMPSQMLEEWMWDADIIKKISSHYQTGKSLDDATINALRSLKNYDTGDFLRRQLSFGLISLVYYGSGEKDLIAIKKDIFSRMRPYMYPAEGHFETSFGHLMGYGSKYYCYLWSKVYALDLFDTIKKGGLLNPIMGRAFRKKVLAKGGSQEPMDLLIDFLGREPNARAFFEDLGL